VRYQTFFENSIDAMLIVENGQFVDCNEAAVRMLGYECKEDVLFQPPENFSPEFQSDGQASAEKARVMIARASELGGYRFEWEHQRKDGSVLPVEVSLSVVSTEATVQLCAVWRDISHEKQVQQDYQVIFNASVEAVFIHDAATGKILDVNVGMQKMFGVDKTEALTMSVSDLSADDSAFSQAEATKFIRKAVTDGPQVFEWLSRRKNGALFWTEVSLSAIENTEPQQIQAIARDITDRKRATAAALASDLRFRSMFENSMSGIAIFSEVDDGEDFIILDFNPASEAIEKVDRDKMVGKRLLEVFPAAIEMGILEVFQRVWRTGISEYFPVTFYKDGVIDGWRENQIYRLPSGEVVVVYNDLTAEKQTEEALRKNEEKYRLLATNMLDMIWTVDLEFNITYVNDAVFDLTGYTPEEVVGRNTLTFMSPIVSERIKKDVQKLIGDYYAGKVSGHKIEAQYICRDGSIVDVEIRAKLLFDADQNLVGFQGRSSDISERKLAEVEKERLLAAIDQVGETIVITDADGLIQYVNPAFERITGYAREEVLGENPSILMSGNMSKAFYQAMWDVLLQGETWTGRFENRKKDGTIYIEDAVISPVKNAEGEVVNYVAIKTDVTEDLLREEQLQQTQKMESIGRLAGGIAHDFNNILQTITGFSELILADMTDTTAHRHDVLEIQKAARLAKDLIQQLLAFSRNQPTEYRRADLNRVLTDAKKMIEQPLGDTVELVMELDSALKPVEVDTTQILQIMMNLVVNARDAMPSGGRLILRTENVELKPAEQPTHSGVTVGEWVCLSVVDTGCGMDELQLSRIFEPFYTTKQLGGGTGLGLSVAYGIVEKHGGWIQVKSEPGKGSVFKIYFPLFAAARPSQWTRIGLHVLVVENDAFIRKVTVETLQTAGYTVSDAPNAVTAKKIFEQNEGAFDLLFNAMELPDQTGVELAEQLRNKKANFAVVLAGDIAPESPAVELIRQKGFGYIQKPFNLIHLLDVIKQTLSNPKGME